MGSHLSVFQTERQIPQITDWPLRQLLHHCSKNYLVLMLNFLVVHCSHPECRCSRSQECVCFIAKYSRIASIVNLLKRPKLWAVIHLTHSNRNHLLEVFLRPRKGCKHNDCTDLLILYTTQIFVFILQHYSPQLSRRRRPVFLEKRCRAHNRGINNKKRCRYAQ